MSVEFKWKKYCYIDQFEMVNTFYLGNILRVRQIKNGPAECPIIRLPNNEYKIKTTGEIKKNKKMIKNRSQGESAMKRTRREIRDIITTNCGGDKMKNCMFITLTYRDVMRDTKKLDNDLNIFIKKFRYHYGKDIQYIMLPAPQLKRKEWSFHIHCIFIFKKKAPFIVNNEIQELWGHGITNSQYKLYGNIDNLGAYFIAHLRDLPLDEVIELGLPYDDKDIKEIKFDYKTGKKLDKSIKIVKGIRTKYYPPKFKILRKSRGLDKPIKKKEWYHEVRKKVGYAIPTYSSTLQIKDKGNGWSNTIKTEEYNLNRNNTKSKPNNRDLEAINTIKKQDEHDKLMRNLTKDDYDF